MHVSEIVLLCLTYRLHAGNAQPAPAAPGSSGAEHEPEPEESLAGDNPMDVDLEAIPEEEPEEEEPEAEPKDEPAESAEPEEEPEYILPYEQWMDPEFVPEDDFLEEPVEEEQDEVPAESVDEDREYRKYESTVWIDDGEQYLTAHKYMAWFLRDGAQTFGPLWGFDIPPDDGLGVWDLMEIDPPDGAVVNPESEPIVTEPPAWSEESDPEPEPLPPGSYNEASDPASPRTLSGCCRGF
ncbi:uncharacterized protein LOC115662022 [Syzygium oleosum]|uniref:uncharacterized protein LOC115662022 n=1 Tax=Syzygium oleosum TaxID=219896 RepID=UPI0024BB9D8C|nr:uncharacterized protein LOC115662022 [Syzygium oleosum]